MNKTVSRDGDDLRGKFSHFILVLLPETERSYILILQVLPRLISTWVDFPLSICDLDQDL